MEKALVLSDKDLKAESTKIVNVKVSNIRPKYQNLKDWIEDKNNIYIGRKFID